jgi:hypothetical protein
VEYEKQKGTNCKSKALGLDVEGVNFHFQDVEVCGRKKFEG